MTTARRGPPSSRRRLLRAAALAALGLAASAARAQAADAATAATGAPVGDTDGGPAGGYATRPEVATYLDHLADETGLSRSWLDRIVAAARYCADAQRLTTPHRAPTAARNWPAYRAHHIDRRRVDDGVAFWREHVATLRRVEERFGVPPAVVVAVLGVETHFGRLTGNYRAIDVFLTLAFDYVRRAELYRDELASYLLLCRDRGWDPLEVRSSFAGAIGLPQFLPSSIRRFAVDFDGDDSIDLHHSIPDAAGSIGNYLAAHGWQRDHPVAVAVRDGSLPLAVAADCVHRGLDPDARWAELAARGVRIEGRLDPSAAVMLVELPRSDPRGARPALYRVGTTNFAALLQYNRSDFYVSAVSDYADELQRAMRAA
ncbi:MAG TPA: lytic murein transglycosylase B [Burkholderiaceae bacterium]|nr:lytic murein transglycosylase B [Burkholderiaceae bacterium]